VVVAVNKFVGDTLVEFAAIEESCARAGVKAMSCSHWAEGSAGAAALAEAVVEMAQDAPVLRPLYEDALPLAEKIRVVAREIYRAVSVGFEPAALAQLKKFEDAGFGHLPVCMAKTQYSFSTDPAAKGAPSGFELPVREVRLSAGAGFVVALCGDILTMPGLPKVPAAEGIFVNENGEIGGLS
jgi:formate--tetrahydrofolate ligase